MEKNTVNEATNMIQETAKVTAKEIIAELKKQKLLKDNKQNPFQKTETLLYSYNDYLAAIQEKKKTINDIRLHGIPEKSKSITTYSGSNGYFENKGMAEKIEEKIKDIENSMNITIKLISFIDAALNTIKDDYYYKIIEMKYFDNNTFDEIGFELKKDISTIYRNRNRLVKKLSIMIFTDEVLSNMFI